MKYISILMLCLHFPAMLFGQQSTTGKERPETTSKGIIKKPDRGQVVIPGVPSYHWYHGCGPTALGMVIGYYDVIGFSDLIDGDASSQTYKVQQAIASAQHYSDYSEPIDYFPDLFADKSDLGGAHQSNCIADYMQTSWSIRGSRYGDSWNENVAQAFIGYVAQQNHLYLAESNNHPFSSTSWYLYRNEINNDRPVVLLVDSDGDGLSDHFVTGVGYDDSDNTYGVYDTWDHQVHWFSWRPASHNYSWGIQTLNTQKLFFRIASTPFPPGGGSINGGVHYLAGETASLTATPDPNFQFINWTEAGDVVSTDGTYSFIVNGNRNLTANFELKSFTITAEVSPEGSGTISGDSLYHYGDTACLLAYPTVGFNFINWTSHGHMLTTDTLYKFRVTGSRQLMANFQLKSYKISAINNPEHGGEVIGCGSFLYGDSAHLEAIPNNGFCFINWTVNGYILSEAPQYSFCVESNHTLTANFLDVTTTDDKPHEADIIAYPNPATKQVHITAPAITGNVRISLYNLKGRLILDKEISLLNGHGNLKINEIKRGTYLMQLMGNDRIYNKKIVVL